MSSGHTRQLKVRSANSGIGARRSAVVWLGNDICLNPDNVLWPALPTPRSCRRQLKPRWIEVDIVRLPSGLYLHRTK